MGPPYYSVYPLLQAFLLIGALNACNQPVQTSSSTDKATQPSTVDVAPSPPSPPTPTSTTNPYREGIELASSAFVLGQTAQSPDDWELITSRWQRAIQALQSVPKDSSHYPTAQTKIIEYRRNLTYAQRQLNQLRNPPPVVSLPPSSDTASVSRPQISPTVTSGGAQQSYEVPILNRRAGTPVIEVTFNGTQRFPMILDTGASHTHISRQMADQLGIVPIGQTQVATASQTSVTFDVGRITSIEVAGIRQTDVPISIGDSVEIGLLGNDFYRDYDLILRADTVTFKLR